MSTLFVLFVLNVCGGKGKSTHLPRRARQAVVGQQGEGAPVDGGRDGVEAARCAAPGQRAAPAVVQRKRRRQRRRPRGRESAGGGVGGGRGGREAAAAAGGCAAAARRAGAAAAAQQQREGDRDAGPGAGGHGCGERRDDPTVRPVRWDLATWAARGVRPRPGRRGGGRAPLRRPRRACWRLAHLRGGTCTRESRGWAGGCGERARARERRFTHARAQPRGRTGQQCGQCGRQGGCWPAPPAGSAGGSPSKHQAWVRAGASSGAGGARARLKVAGKRQPGGREGSRQWAARNPPRPAAAAPGPVRCGLSS